MQTPGDDRHEPADGKPSGAKQVGGAAQRLADADGRGEDRAATAPQLERTADASQARLVVLDLRELTFLDSSGLHAILHAGIRARQAGRWLVLVRVPSNVERLLTLPGRPITSRSPMPTP